MFAELVAEFGLYYCVWIPWRESSSPSLVNELLAEGDVACPEEHLSALHTTDVARAWLELLRWLRWCVLCTPRRL